MRSDDTVGAGVFYNIQMFEQLMFEVILNACLVNVKRVTGVEAVAT